MKDATVTMTSRRQITVPARLARALGLEPGARFVVRLDGQRIVLEPVPDSFTDSLAGRLAGRYGDPDRYVREERAAWGAD